MLPKFRESGLLPVGVEVDGVVHRKYELRPTTVADLIASEQWEGEHGRRACLFQRQLLTLGSLPKEKITVPLLQGMTYLDYEALQYADGRLIKQQRTFRDPPKEPKASDPTPSHKDGVE